jgi:hypothetical protein
MTQVRWPLLAQSEHLFCTAQCPLSGVKRISGEHAIMSALDPKRASINFNDPKLPFSQSWPKWVGCIISSKLLLPSPSRAFLALVFYNFRRWSPTNGLHRVLGKRSAPTFNWLAHRELLRFTAPFAVTTEAPPRLQGRRGRIPEHAYRPELATVRLCLHREASAFWIILLLFWPILSSLSR